MICAEKADEVQRKTASRQEMNLGAVVIQSPQ